MKNTLEEVIPTISVETGQFFANIERVFGTALFDRVLVLEEKDSKYELVYYAQYPDTCPITRELHEKEMANVDYFIQNILRKRALADGEWVFKCREEDGELFDIMIRIGNYYIAFNNSQESLKSLRRKHPFDEAILIEELKKYTRLFEIQK